MPISDKFFDRIRELKEQYEKLTTEHPEIKSLTDKEMLVLEKMLSDKTLAEIATELNLTRSGVHFHSKNIYKKLGVHSRTQLLVNYKNLF